MKTLLPGLLFILLLCSKPILAQNNSISFDGTDDYADCGNNSILAATNIRTLECWVNFSTLAGAHEILSKSVEFQGIELIQLDGNLGFYCMRDGGNASFILYSGANLETGRWYHLAAAWDGSTRESMRLYVNGVSVGARTDVGNINGGITDPAGSFKIGQWSQPADNRFFSGMIDEVRVWSVERTINEINKSMFSVAPNAAGLTAYYKMDEASGNTITNLSPNTGLDGTLINGAARVSSPVQYSRNALDIDGANDYVTIPGNAAYNISSGTVEFWARPNDLSAVNACMLGVRGIGGTRFSFHITNTYLGFWNGSNFYTLPAAFATGTWYHFAIVCDGSNTTAYVNGNPIGQFGAAFGSANDQTLIIGRVIEATQFEPFNGAIDEVRIWNIQRSQEDIESTINSALHGDEAGLVALFGFDYGVAEGDNAGMLNALDLSNTNNNGTLVNFGLTGTASNFVANLPLIPLPVEFSSFTVVKQNRRAILHWQTAQEQNSAVFVIERSSNEEGYSAIGQLAAAGNSATPRNYTFTDNNPATGVSYYRLKQIDLDGRFMYSAARQIEFARTNKLYWFSTSSNTIEVRLEKGDKEQFKVADMRGSVIKTGRLSNGRATLIGLPPGIYNLFVDGLNRQAIRFAVQ